MAHTQHSKRSAAIPWVSLILQAMCVKVCRHCSNLTQRDIQISWTKECNEFFQCLKKLLTEAPIIAFPHFDLNSSPFILETDACAGGLDAILQHDGHVIAYASHVLNKAQFIYSVIQQVLGSSVWYEAVQALPVGATI